MGQAALDDLMGRAGFQWAAIIDNFPAFGLNQAGDCAEQGCFAGPVGTDERDNITLLDLEGYAVQSSNCAVAYGQVLYFEHLACYYAIGKWTASVRNGLIRE